MFENDFYIVTDLKKDTDVIEAAIELDEHHPVFKGHFPGQPVVPGVCLIQIAKEILAYCLNRKLRLINADDIKFLGMLDPRKQKNIDMKINYILAKNDCLDANIIFQKRELIFCKIRCNMMSIE